MMKSPVLKLVGMVSWVVTGLAALNYGLAARGHDLMAVLPAGLQEAAVWLIALSGLASLALFVWSVVGCDSCDTCC